MNLPHAPGYIWVTTTRLHTPLPAYTLLALDGSIHTGIRARLVWLVANRYLRRVLRFMYALALTIIWNTIWDMVLALHRNRPLTPRGHIVGNWGGHSRQLELFELGEVA